MTNDMKTYINNYGDAVRTIEELEEAIYKLTENPTAVGLLLSELQKRTIERHEALKALENKGMSEDEIISIALGGTDPEGH